MCPFPKSYAGALTPTELGNLWEVIRFRQDMSVASCEGIRTLIRRDRGACVLPAPLWPTFLMLGQSRKAASAGEPSSGDELAGAMILAFPTSGLWEINVCHLSHPVYSIILLLQLDLR